MKTTMELKPYSEYKESGVPWLGKVPGHWSSRPGMAVLKEKQVKNTGLKEKTVLTLSYGKIKIKPQDKLHGLVPETFETYQIVEPSDIIIRPTDLQNDKVSLRVGKVKNKGIITSAYICMKPVNGLQPDYAHLLLHSLDLMKVFYSLGSGLRQNLSWIDFKRLPCYIPTKEEQSQIARFLNYKSSQIARFIHAKKRLLELLKEQKQAIINDAVTGKIDVRTGKPYPKYKESGVEWLGMVPEGWEVWKLNYLAIIGNGSTPSRANLAYWTNSGFPWLNSSCVNRCIIDSSDQFVTDTALKECHLPIVKPGSVLVAITGQGKTRGTAAFLTIESTINQHIAYIRPTQSKLRAEYLVKFLKNAYYHLRAISDDSGSTKGAITCQDLKNLKIVLPSVVNQKQMESWIDEKTHNIDLAISRAQREISLIEEYRTRLIADVVTGKIDVRGIEIPDVSFENDTDNSGTEDTDIEQESFEEMIAGEAE